MVVVAHVRKGGDGERGPVDLQPNGAVCDCPLERSRQRNMLRVHHCEHCMAELAKAQWTSGWT